MVVPPIEDFYYTPHRGSFIGAHIVKKILIDLGHEVHIFIFPNTKKPKIIPLPNELNYLKEFLIEKEIGPFSHFSSYKRFGVSYKEAATRILSISPEIVFISCFAFCYAKSTIRLAQELKKQNRAIKIVVGGSGVSVYPKYFEDTGLFFKVLTKEAEYAIPKFFGRDMYFTLVPCIVNTKNTKKVSYFSTYLTRGCPKGCGFCSVSLVHGRKLRKVNFNAFLANLPKVEDSKKVLLNFEDDNILLQKGLFLSLLKKIKQKYKNVLFSCENGIDYREFDLDTLVTLHNLGFRQFNISLGNINKKISTMQRRTILEDKLFESIDYINNNNIDTIIYFISGFKDETWEDSINNLIFLANLGNNIRVGLSMFYPVPGILGFENTDIFKDKSPVLLCSSSAYPWNQSLTTNDFITLFRLVRLVNYLKRSDIDSSIYDLVKKIIHTKKLYTFVKGKTYPVEVKNYNRDMVKFFLDNYNLEVKNYEDYHEKYSCNPFYIYN